MVEPVRRWYLTPGGRIVRAALGIPFLALAAYLFISGGAGNILVALIPLVVGASLPAAALVQEPD